MVLPRTESPKGLQRGHLGRPQAGPWEGLREGPIYALDGRSVNAAEAGDQKQDRVGGSPRRPRTAFSIPGAEASIPPPG